MKLKADRLKKTPSKPEKSYAKQPSVKLPTKPQASTYKETRRAPTPSPRRKTSTNVEKRQQAQKNGQGRKTSTNVEKRQQAQKNGQGSRTSQFSRTTTLGQAKASALPAERKQYIIIAISASAFFIVLTIIFLIAITADSDAPISVDSKAKQKTYTNSKTYNKKGTPNYLGAGTGEYAEDMRKNGKTALAKSRQQGRSEHDKNKNKK